MRILFSLLFSVLAACASTVNADTLPEGTTLKFELGGAMPGIVSDASTVVVNNSGPAPYSPLQQLLGTDFVDAGTGHAFGLEVTRPHIGNTRLFFDASHLAAVGDEPFPVFIGAGALPGSYDDGYLILSSFNPIMQVTTRSTTLNAGITRPLTSRIQLRYGVAFGRVSQDVSTSLATISSQFLTTAVSRNSMAGVTIGAAYRHPVSPKLTLGLNSNLSLFYNSYTYAYRNTDLTNDLVQQNLTASGHTGVVRLGLEATARLKLGNGVALTSTLGLENFSNVATGFENLLNPNSTATTFSEATGTVRNAYARVGISWTF